MNEQTEALIRELAEKLGTTTEHLWEVLVRQAPITATIELLVMAMWIVILILAFRFIRDKTRVPSATEEDRFPRAQWDNDEGAGIIAWFLFTVIAGFSILMMSLSLSRTLSGLLNPEYWALKQLI